MALQRLIMKANMCEIKKKLTHAIKHLLSIHVLINARTFFFKELASDALRSIVAENLYFVLPTSIKRSKLYQARSLRVARKLRKGHG